ncbi:OmpA family protein [Pseudothauera nasutitermitis]|uniref:OmpA family protein n=1 Tax=Pseudothauera nasutitermitis TaxID=2565930 RepID=A0A4S4AUD5_9RHOO|nr:OmpA family protein [Pseudothauera nasutitermitis]THF63561.1 OmpA family protein [Pseudothauera nasutitermitis]
MSVPFRSLPLAALLCALLAACATVPGDTPPPPASSPASTPARPVIDWAGISAGLARELEALPGIQLDRQDEGALRLRIPAADGFASGQNTPRAELAARLDRIAAVLRTQPMAAVEVIGHTDSLGSELFNLRLSIERAEAVMEALRGRGVELLRLSADGRGEAEPIADNGTPEGRATNRRVELILRPLY